MKVKINKLWFLASKEEKRSVTGKKNLFKKKEKQTLFYPHVKNSENPYQ